MTKRTIQDTAAKQYCRNRSPQTAKRNSHSNWHRRAPEAARETTRDTNGQPTGSLVQGRTTEAVQSIQHSPSQQHCLRYNSQGRCCTNWQDESPSNDTRTEQPLLQGGGSSQQTKANPSGSKRRINHTKSIFVSFCRSDVVDTSKYEIRSTSVSQFKSIGGIRMLQETDRMTCNLGHDL